MTRDAIVIVNAGSGGGNDRSLVDRLARLLELRPASTPRSSSRTAATRSPPRSGGRSRSGRDMIVAGGGDGTVSTVAAALVDTDIVFGVLPLGTLNHFAKDLGVPLELADAVALLIVEGTAEAGRRRRGQRPRSSSTTRASACTPTSSATASASRSGSAAASGWPSPGRRLAVLRRFPFLGVAPGRSTASERAAAARLSSSSATTSTGWKASRSASASGIAATAG